MGSIGDPFSTSLPPVGSAGPQYATDYNAIMTEVMSRLSNKVPLSSLLNNSNLDLNGQAALNAAYVSLLNTTSTPGASPVNRITAYQGNLYWVSPAGVVRITNGGTLDATSLGGITGDYGGANPAQFRFDDANARYDTYDDFGANQWAAVRARYFDVTGGLTSSVRARIAYGGAGSVQYTLPPSTPAGSKLLQMDSSGNIAASSTLPTGEHVQLQGSGKYKHGGLIMAVPVTLGNTNIVVTGAVSGAAPGITCPANSDTYIALPGIIPNLHRVLSVTLFFRTAVTATVQCALYTATSGVFAAVSGATAFASGSSVTLTPSSPSLALDPYHLRVTVGPSGNGTPYKAEINFDAP